MARDPHTARELHTASEPHTRREALALPSAETWRGPELDRPAFRIPVRRSLRMHPMLAGSVALAVLLGLLGYALSREPVYEAESRVYVEPVPTRILSDSPGNFDGGRYESFLQEQMETVERPDILLAAVHSLPVGVWQQPGETAEAAASRLGTAVRTERVSTSYQLAISVRAENPGAAAAAANAVTEAYLAAGAKDAQALSAGRLDLLTAERKRIMDEMDARRAEQATLGASLGVANPNGAGADIYDAQLQSVRDELTAARQAHAMAEAQLAALSGAGGQRSPGAAAAAQEAVATDPGVSSMRIAAMQRKTALLAQMQGMKTGNPIYQDDQQELARLDQQMTGMTTGMQAEAEQRTEAKLRQELARTTDLEARLTSEVTRQTALAADAGPKLQRAAELTADLARLQARYAIVDDSLRSLQLETSGSGSAHLAVAATVPSAPVPSKSRIVLVLALPLALILGLAAAVLALRMDGRLYTAEDVEEALGFPPLGVLPGNSEGASAGMEESLLRLAAGLEAAHRRGGTKSFVFTAVSARSDFGKALEALERWLVKLGLRMRVLQAAEMLRGDRGSRAAEEAGYGRKSLSATPLDQRQQNFDLLLIAAQPLLHSAEAEYAVRSSDAVILVVESGVTTQHELLAAAALLRRLQVSEVGVLLQDGPVPKGVARVQASSASEDGLPLPARMGHSGADRLVSARETADGGRKAIRVEFASGDRQSGPGSPIVPPYNQPDAVSAVEPWTLNSRFERPEEFAEEEMAVSGSGKGSQE